MIYVIASDIHGDSSSLRGLLLRESRAGAFLLLGDSCLPKEEISPFVSVLGNCDMAFREDYPLHRSIRFPSGHRAFLSHHPLGSDSLRELKKAGYMYFFHGHTHVVEDYIDESGIRVVCPGSLSLPRDSDRGSYMLVKADESGEEITFKKA